MQVSGLIGRRMMLTMAVTLWAGAGLAQQIIKGTDAVGPLHTPAIGSAERRAIMDAARVPIQGAIGVPVVFVASVLNTDGHWAYLGAVPHNPDGSPIDWSRTRFAAEMKEGFMSDEAMVLLRDDGVGWQVVEWVMGPTDVFWYGWIDAYGLPERLFR